MPRRSSNKTFPFLRPFAVLACVGCALWLYACREKPKEAPLPTEGKLQVYAVDVGQGDSLVILTPGGKSVLIDAGLNQEGENVVKFLREHNVSSLDLVVATHPHADHIGGIPDVLRAVPVKTFLDSGQAHPTKTYTKMLELVKDKVPKFIVARAGQKFNLDSGIVLDVLGPSDPPIDEDPNKVINANSVILKLTYGSFSMLFTGDSEDETEDRLEERSADVRARVIKIAHHGSRYASTESFLKKVGAEAAIISCGADNDYGHPSQPVLDRLRRMGIDLHRTDLEGTILVVSDGKTFQIRGERAPTGDLWAGRKPIGREEMGGGDFFRNRKSK